MYERIVNIHIYTYIYSTICICKQNNVDFVFKNTFKCFKGQTLTGI